MSTNGTNSCMRKNYNRLKNSQVWRRTEILKGWRKKKPQEAYLKELQAFPCRHAEALKAEV